MKKFIQIIMFLVIKNVIAGTIIDKVAIDYLIDSIGKDKFVAAINANPNICYDAYLNPTVFTTDHQPNLTTEIASYNTTTTQLIPAYTAADYESLVVTYESNGSQDQISYLSNPYNPNGNNVTQNLPTSSYTYSTAKSISTSTTCGWKVGVSMKYKLGIPIAGEDTTITGEVNGSTTEVTAVTDSQTYSVPSTIIIVPAGCTAVVEQSLRLAKVSGKFNFQDVIANGIVSFTAITNNSDKRSGYVNLIDLVKYGDIPQTLLKVNESGDLVINGTGVFTGYNSSVYTMTYHYEEAQPMSHCMPPTVEEQERALNGREAYGVRKIGNREFSYTIVPKLLQHNRSLNTQQKPLEAASDKCWANMTNII